MSTTLILGGTSAVAMSYARLLMAEGRSVHLVGRRADALKANVSDLSARGEGGVSFTVADLSDTSNIDASWTKILAAAPDIDHILIAYGLLGDQSESQDQLDKLELYLRTNFTSTALWAEYAFRHFQTVGAGQVTVIGSVAGDRGRQSNYHYGSAKGGVDVFVSGMAHRAARLVEADVGVTLVKPGFIDTPMTDGLDKGGPLWASPERIAAIIRKAENSGKTKIYAPWFWRYILLIIKSVPFFVFKRTGL